MRKFSFLTILALMLFSLVPVFGQEAVSYDDVDPTGATVIFWHQHTGARADELAKIVDEFNTTNEWKITVEASNQGGYDDIFQKMTLGLAGGLYGSYRQLQEFLRRQRERSDGSGGGGRG